MVEWLFAAKTTLINNQDIFQSPVTEQLENVIEHCGEYNYLSLCQLLRYIP